MSDDDLQLPPLDERAGPAEPIASDRAKAIIDAAIDEAARVRPVRRARSRGLMMLAIAAAFVLLIGAALAATLPRLLSAPAVPPASVSASPAPPEPTQSVAPLEATSETPAASDSAPAASVPPTPKEPPVADLLRRANELRIKHRWAEAEETYQRVIARSPHSEEAYTAEVAAASIRLEHLGDPKGALRLDRAALADRPHGALGEEASYGIAEAERALGDERAEADALRAFVAAYPNSVTRSVAERRLAELAHKAP